MATDRGFYIVSYRGFLTVRDEWAAKLYAATFKDLAAVRQNIRRLQDYKPEVFADVEGATDDTDRLYLLEELFQ